MAAARVSKLLFWCLVLGTMGWYAANHLISVDDRAKQVDNVYGFGLKNAPKPWSPEAPNQAGAYVEEFCKALKDGNDASALLSYFATNDELTAYADTQYAAPYRTWFFYSARRHDLAWGGLPPDLWVGTVNFALQNPNSSMKFHVWRIEAQALVDTNHSTSSHPDWEYKGWMMEVYVAADLDIPVGTLEEEQFHFEGRTQQQRMTGNAVSWLDGSLTSSPTKMLHSKVHLIWQVVFPEPDHPKLLGIRVQQIDQMRVSDI